MNYSRQQLQEIYLTLPQDLKEAIFSVENAEKIYQIAQKHQVPKEKISQLASVIGHILLSVLAMEKFISSLELNLDIERDKAQKIADEIKQELFQPVINSLTKIQKEKFPQAVSKPSLPQPPTPSQPRDNNIIDLKNLPNQ